MIGFRQPPVGTKCSKTWRVIGATLPLLALSLAPTSASADGPTAVRGDQLVLAAHPMPPTVLDEHRGGFSLGIFDVSIGGEVRSTIDGVFQLVSTFWINDKVGNRFFGGIKSSSVSAANPSVPVSDPVPAETNVPDTVDTGSSIPDAVEYTAETEAQDGGPGASFSHNFNNGITAIISNQINNVTAEQTITLDATVENYRSIAQSYKINLHNSAIAANVARFLPSR